MELRWQDASWLVEAHEWIDRRLVMLGLTRTGDIEQAHVSLWSMVLRVPTASGDVWFKASDVPLRHEAALVELLATRRPDCMLKPLASDTERGWMLMTDAGESLRVLEPVEGNLDRWVGVLRRYARLQLDLTDAVDTMLALGVPDMRLTVLPERYEQLVHEIGAERRFRDATPYVTELCDALRPFGIAETVQHDDLHDGQVFVKDGRQLLMDWGDSCISHPFFTLSVTLEGVLAWGLDDVEHSVDTAPFRDAYLEPFAELYDGDLVAATDIAARLGWACRAVNGHVPGQESATETRLRMFLDGRP
ncbi:MAG: phosphotransferase [Nocardioidaceae bacterium]